MIDVANIALRAAALGAAALCLVWSYAEAGRFGGPGIGGGLSHMGAAMSIHAPGGGEFRGGFSRPAGAGEQFTRPGEGGAWPGKADAGERWPNGYRPYPHPHPVPYPYPVPAPVGRYWDWYADPHWDYPVGAVAAADATAAAAADATAAAAVTLGSTVYALPENCKTAFRNNLTFFDCNGIWYQPHYLGSGVTYVVVSAPTG
jgi:hypothetical protein